MERDDFRERLERELWRRLELAAASPRRPGPRTYSALRCFECGTVSLHVERGWRAYEAFGEIAVYCPECDERELQW